MSAPDIVPFGYWFTVSQVWVNLFKLLPHFNFEVFRNVAAFELYRTWYRRSGGGLKCIHRRPECGFECEVRYLLFLQWDLFPFPTQRLDERQCLFGSNVL